MGDRRGIAASLHRLAWATSLQGDFSRAMPLDQEALALRRALGDDSGIPDVLHHLGWLAGRMGDLEQSATLLEEALALQRVLGDRRGIARSLCHLDAIVGRQGGHRRALDLLAESVVLCRDVGERDLLAEGLESLTGAVLAHGRLERAAQFGGAAEALRTALEMPLPPALQIDHARLMQALDTALGVEERAAAWAAGQATTLDEVVALALMADQSG